jgi:glycine/D-amino acid oxidase-like deaminating enzyme
MPTLLVVGAGLFGSQAAAYARSKGIEALLFDPALPGAASPAAAGLFREDWAGKKLHQHFRNALPVLERLYAIGQVSLTDDDGSKQSFLFVPPSAILEPHPIAETVTAVGDGWLEAGGRVYQGCIYVAAGIWCPQFLPALAVYGKAGSAFLFRGEREGHIRQVGRGHQAVAFVRDPGSTYFSDGTAERQYTGEHDQATLVRAAAMGLTDEPHRRHWGCRPYTPGGPAFVQVASRTWLATGGRKMGTILGASFARRLVEEELP